MLNDLRYAARSLRKAPVLVFSSVFCLALGIAASVTVFSSVDELVLKPLPYEDAERMVNVRWKHTKEDWDAYGLTTPDFLAYREQCRSFEHFVAFRFWFHTIGTPSASEHTHGFSVTSGFFKLLGIKPLLGRGFEIDEEFPSNSNVAVLSHSLWQRRFNGDRDVLGKTINVDGAPRTIVGVLPDTARAQFRSGMGNKIELWLPLAFPDNERASGGWHSVWGKLKQDISLEQANEELKRLSTARAKEFPDPYEHRLAWLESSQQEQARRGRETVTLMVAAVAMFLLLACCKRCESVSFTQRIAATRVRHSCCAGSISPVDGSTSFGGVHFAFRCRRHPWHHVQLLGDFSPGDNASFFASTLCVT